MLSMCGLPSLHPPGIVAGVAQEEMNPVVNLMSLVGCSHEDCQARKLNKEDAMDRCKWRKMIKEAR